MADFVVEQFECLLGSHIVAVGEPQLALAHSQVDLGEIVDCCSWLE